LGISLARGGRVQRDDLLMAMIMFLPGFIVLVLLGTYPILSVLTLAFQKRSLFDVTGVWTGLGNFHAVLTAPLFWTGVRNTVVFTFSTVLLQTVLGMAVALLLHRPFPARNIFRGFMLFSYVVPTVVAAIIWRFMLSDSVGIIYHFIRTNRLPIANTWFASPSTAMPTVILVTVWKFFPFMVINFLARLQTIDEQLYEAAKVDGASSFQTFRHITLPSLMPVVIIVLLLRTIWTFNNYDVIALLTGGGPLNSTRTLPLLVYNTLFNEFSMGRSSAMAFLMTIILVGAMVLYLRAYYHAEERLA